MPVPLHPGAERYFKEKGVAEVGRDLLDAARHRARRSPDSPEHELTMSTVATCAPVDAGSAMPPAGASTSSTACRPAAATGLAGRLLFWIARRLLGVPDLRIGRLRHPAEPGAARPSHVGFLVCWSSAALIANHRARSPRSGRSSAGRLGHRRLRASASTTGCFYLDLVNRRRRADAIAARPVGFSGSSDRR